MGEMKLDISEKSLILEVPKKYYLDIKLSYKVKEEDGTAKFDKKSKKLKVTLPVIPDLNNEVEEVLITPIDNDQSPDFQVDVTEQDQIQEEKNSNESNTLDINNPLLIVDQNDNKKSTEGVVLIEDVTNKQQEVKKIQSKYEKFSFRKQQNCEIFFLMINLPNYIKQQFEYEVIQNNTVLFKYESEDVCYYSKIKSLKNVEKVSFEFVTDYIVLKLSKQEQTEWQEEDIQDEAVTYENVRKEMEDIKEDLRKKQEEIMIEQKKIDDAQKKIKELEQQALIEKNEQIKIMNKPKEEMGIASDDEEEQKEQPKTIPQTQTNQFIQFEHGFAFELD